MPETQSKHIAGTEGHLPVREELTQAFAAAWPIMLGYVGIGLPCGILSVAVGMEPWMVFVMSLVFYSGAGQFMIPNMWLAGNPLAAIIASVSLVNTRQLLYGTSLSQFCGGIGKRLAFLFGATVTDESFGVNLAKFINGSWDVRRALFVNLFSLSSWTLSTFFGALLGEAVSIPTALASFAMTSLFICLLCLQKGTPANVTAALAAATGVVLCKCAGLSGPAIFIGAVLGVAAGVAFASARAKRAGDGEAGWRL